MPSVETSRLLTTRLSMEAMGADREGGGLPVWQFSGDCLSPVELRLAGRPDKVLVGLGLEPDRSYIGYLYARCRHCDRCLDHRRRLWTARAIQEINCSARSWFATFTVRPDERVRALYRAQICASRAEVNWGDLDDKERFTRVAGVLNEELTRYLKRVRKNSGARFRYLLVTEAHKDGFPHFHMLLHEQLEPVRKALLETAWKLGFSQFKLVDGLAPAGYVCKYLAKSALTRIRASQKYGQTVTVYAAEQLNVVSAALTKCKACGAAENPSVLKEGPLTSDCVK